MSTKKLGSRKVVINASTLADTPDRILELGPAGTTQQVSTLMIQFVPDLSWNGEVVVVGRMVGQAAQDGNAPFVPVPYRIVSLDNVAADYAMVSDAITGTATIQVPTNGMTIGLLGAADPVGSLTAYPWDLQGPSL